MISVNEYENGRAKSLGFESNGQAYTAGVVEPGRYRFSTSQEEHLTVSLGSIRFKLPDGSDQTLAAGQKIIIPPGVEFELEAGETSSYICAYK